MTAVSASAAEFNDIKGHWAEDVINELADKDIIHGVSDTEFNPDGTVTRAEFLKMALGTVVLPTCRTGAANVLMLPHPIGTEVVCKVHSTKA